MATHCKGGLWLSPSPSGTPLRNGDCFRAGPRPPRVAALHQRTRAATSPPLETSKPRVSLVSLGCPKNTVDSEVMLGNLERSGFSVVDDHESADAIVINTCAFVEDAKAESLDAIMEATQLKAEGGAVQRVVVTGCLAQRYADDLAAQLPEVDLVVGFERYADLAQNLHDVLGEAAGATQTAVQVGSPTFSPFPEETQRHRLTPRHTAYLRVAEGCNHACTFCAIPGFRGRFRSKPPGLILEEARALVAGGALELNLIAEDTNQYGQDRRGGTGLAGLLANLAEIPGLRWIRILYAYPSYFTEDLIQEIATNPKVCKYIDIPLQHINNLVLLSMNRPPADHTLRLLGTLRDRIPDLALRTTFISGFPGESKGAHEELAEFSDSFGFQRGGAFAYSEEDGTPAAGFPEQIPQEVREERRDELMSIQQRNSIAFAESLVGKEIDVLVDGIGEGGELLGRTQWDAPEVDGQVYLLTPLDPGVAPAEVGQMRRCRVVSSCIMDIEAEPIA
ncbi:hypothetical protein ACKKBG_A05135 [Auxenochlorella protothecoides x Auxenochlorella symbiontica]